MLAQGVNDGGGKVTEPAAAFEIRLDAEALYGFVDTSDRVTSLLGNVVDGQEIDLRHGGFLLMNICETVNVFRCAQNDKTILKPLRERTSERMSETEAKSTFDEWALVELFGHSRIVGHVTEQSIAGGAFVRVDVPDKDGNTIFTRFFGHGAIYSMSPIGRDLALQLAARQDVAPVSRYDLPSLKDKTDGSGESDET